MDAVKERDYTFKYLTVSHSEQAWGLYVTGCGIGDIPAGSPYPNLQHPVGYMFNWAKGRVLDEMQVIYITRGEGFFESAVSSQQVVREGSVILLFPGVWHRYMPSRRTGWRECWISYDGVLARELIRKGILSPKNPIVEIGFNETISHLYHEVLDLIDLEGIGHKEIAASLTYQILVRVHTAWREQQFGGTEAYDVVQRARVYLLENVSNQINMEDVASELNVGYSWFRKTFRNHTGLSPAQYYLQLKINKAKELLTYTSLSVKEIAEMAGFQSPHYFSRIFKKKQGVAPVDWRAFTQGGATGLHESDLDSLLT